MKSTAFAYNFYEKYLKLLNVPIACLKSAQIIFGAKFYLNSFIVSNKLLK